MEQPSISLQIHLQRMPTAAPLMYTSIQGHVLPQSKPRHTDREASGFSQHMEQENQATPMPLRTGHCAHVGAPRAQRGCSPASACCSPLCCFQTFFILLKNKDQET